MPGGMQELWVQAGLSGPRHESVSVWHQPPALFQPGIEFPVLKAKCPERFPRLVAASPSPCPFPDTQHDGSFLYKEFIFFSVRVLLTVCQVLSSMLYSRVILTAIL